MLSICKACAVEDYQAQHPDCRTCCVYWNDAEDVQHEEASTQPTEGRTPFTVEIGPSVAWLMLGKFCVAKYSDIEFESAYSISSGISNAEVSANAAAFHLNKVFGFI